MPAFKTPGVDWDPRQNTPLRRLLNRLEKFSLWLERPVNRLVADPRFNPLYHTGTLTVFLLLVILLTGVYLTMFYQYGFTASYQAVNRIESSWVGHVVRAIHRYSSAAALLTALLHGWRTFFMDRFRGPRALAWATGMLMSAAIWAAGVTGYWLIWDERAQVLNQSLLRLLQTSAGGRRFLLDFLLTEKAGSGWVFMLLLIALHIGLYLLLAIFFWYHILRLNRPKIMPPQFWSLGGLALLLLAALLAPAGMLAAANPQQIPAQVPIDVFFLFYLPAALQAAPLWLWGGAVLGLALLSALPWLLRRKPLPLIRVHAARCTGCTLCAADCPYKALSMVERSDGLPHKYLAQLDPKLCVSCGICIGSCPTLALTLGDQPAEAVWEYALAQAAQKSAQPIQVVFTCERHAQHGAAALLQAAGGPQSAGAIRIVPLTCIGMAHPDLASQALAAGAGQVSFIGCPPEDCANREGNLWLQQRLEGQRLPKFRQALQPVPVSSAWLPPDQFSQGLPVAGRSAPATAYTTELSRLSWRSFLPALALLAAALLLQIGLTNLPYRPFPTRPANLQITLQQAAGAPLRQEQVSGPAEALDVAEMTQPVLTLWLDGQLRLEKAYQPGSLRQPNALLEQISLPAGSHSLRLEIHDSALNRSVVLFDQTVTLAAGQVFHLQYRPLKLKGDPRAGEQIFYENSMGTNAGCMVCHALEPNRKLVGPSLAGIGSQAAGRVPGLSAEAYIHQSIVEPEAYTVPGFPLQQMPSNLSEILSEEQINDLVAFLLTLE